jgi:branched-chain amino acid transport system substrate-binding protein
MRRFALASLVAACVGWLTACGGASTVAVKTASCGPVEFQGKGKPRYLIVSDLPLRAPAGSREQVAGIRYVLRRKRFAAGQYRVGYQSCDDSSAAVGGRDIGRCTANTKAYASNLHVLGVIGPYNSECAAVEIPIANAAPDGPLAMIGTATTNPELTAKVPAGSPRSPERYYPKGVRNFVRLSAPDQFQAGAAALLAKQHRLRRVFVLDDGEGYGTEIAGWFREAAKRQAIPVVGSASWDPKAKQYRQLVQRVKAARPDGVYLSGFAFLHGTLVLKELRRQLGKRVLVFAPDGFSDAGEDVHEAGAASEDLLFTVAGVPPRDAGPLGKAILHKTGPEPLEQYGALYGAAAASVLLDAIAGSDGSRASVVKGLFHASTPAGIMGRFSFDRNGDPTVGAMSVFRIARGKAVLEPTIYPRSAAASS